MKVIKRGGAFASLTIEFSSKTHGELAGGVAGVSPARRGSVRPRSGLERGEGLPLLQNKKDKTSQEMTGNNLRADLYFKS